MQKCINDYKEMLKVTSKMEFKKKEKERGCPFCVNAKKVQYKDHNGYYYCHYCMINKYFGVKCGEAFPLWWNFDQNYEMPLKKRKALLRSVLRFELKQWGLK